MSRAEEVSVSALQREADEATRAAPLVAVTVAAFVLVLGFVLWTLFAPRRRATPGGEDA